MHRSKCPYLVDYNTAFKKGVLFPATPAKGYDNANPVEEEHEDVIRRPAIKTT